MSKEEKKEKPETEKKPEPTKTKLKTNWLTDSDHSNEKKGRLID